MGPRSHRARRRVLVVASLAAIGSVQACGPSMPREQDIYHEAVLRPGTTAPETDAERELLARMPTLVTNEPVRLGDHTFVPLPAYASASGRRCAPVRESSPSLERTRVACEDGDHWVFVPDVFGGDDPFAATAGSP